MIFTDIFEALNLSYYHINFIRIMHLLFEICMLGLKALKNEMVTEFVLGTKIKVYSIVF